jgi:hypothetical protein
MIPLDQFHQQWLRDTWYYIEPGGHRRWGLANDQWDFDIGRWRREWLGKLFWIRPGDPEMRLISSPDAECPYEGLPGRRKFLVIKKGEIVEQPLPSGKALDDLFD